MMSGVEAPSSAVGHAGVRANGVSSGNVRARSAVITALTVTVVAVMLSACGIHISKNGISGNILGHKFSAASHSLPAGFPSEVPLPDNSKVLGGGGVSDSSGTVYDAAFAVSGTVGPATSAYEAKFRSAGYTLSNVHAPSPISNGSSTTGSGSNSTSTTVTVTGGTFTANNGSWTVGVLTGSSSSAVGSELKAGQVGMNITVTPTSHTSTT
jgi:hypothetical protein